jgi:hypothetical protein
MLRFLGSSHTFCDGASRRDFLQIGAFGAGLTLADMLRPGRPALPGKQPLGRTRRIMVYLNGGPSHMDMYDLKPDAPKEFRGEFNPIATNVPGVQICEHMPLQAKMWDKLACIRSITSVDEQRLLVMTGYGPREPHRGSPVLRLGGVKLRRESRAIPPFVSLADEPRTAGYSARAPAVHPADRATRTCVWLRA